MTAATRQARMAEVRAALARVTDPELSLSIVDVGLVYGVVACPIPGMPRERGFLPGH